MEEHKDNAHSSLADTQRYCLEHIQTAEREGISPRVSAQRHGLRTVRFYYWRSTLRKRGVLASKHEARPTKTTCRSCPRCTKWCR